MKYHQKKGIPHSATQENDEQSNNKQDVAHSKTKAKGINYDLKEGTGKWISL